MIRFIRAGWHMLRAFKSGELTTTSLRETLNRQSGMYRVAAKISDEQIDGLVGDFCRSDGGCLRTILWKRDASDKDPSLKLPPEKFDLAVDQYPECENAAVSDRGYRIDSVAVPGSV